MEQPWRGQALILRCQSYLLQQSQVLDVSKRDLVGVRNGLVLKTPRESLTPKSIDWEIYTDHRNESLLFSNLSFVTPARALL